MTPKEREVMELALEALENLTEGHSIGGKKLGVNAITAIKEALANHIEDNLAMVAQPAVTESHKQSTTCGEPVGHRDGYWCDDLTCKKCYSADFRFKHKNSVDKESLTTPPTQQSCLQRPSRSDIKPLTDEHIEAIWRDGIYSEGLLYEFNLFARAIEAAHGITSKE